MEYTSAPMSESADETPETAPTPEAGHEDDRRQKAAEVNRKRSEEQWLRNKQRWIRENFPAKGPDPEKPAV